MKNAVCPWWLGYTLLNPFRRFVQDPNVIVKKYLAPNMKVIDIGCAMGYFSLPMAQIVGANGKIICVDMQEKMIRVLTKRAEKADLLDRIETRKCSYSSLGIADLKEEIDFVLAFAVVHEVADKERLFAEIIRAMNPKGKLLIAEPKGHVSQNDFEDTIALAQTFNLHIIERPEISRSNSVVLEKKN